ncbi:Rho GTPase activation protein [Limtongia smithiae]|uniref:Rho GTPase activation protein n=1 Tax=Limtongia smithiae TaxID=1125753 RepID=UPI0034CF1E39
MATSIASSATVSVMATTVQRRPASTTAPDPNTSLSPPSESTTSPQQMQLVPMGTSHVRRRGARSLSPARPKPTQVSRPTPEPMERGSLFLRLKNLFRSKPATAKPATAPPAINSASAPASERLSMLGAIYPNNSRTSNTLSNQSLILPNGVAPQMEDPTDPYIFGRPIDESTARAFELEQGEQVPRIVSTCGRFLRQYGLDVQGVFRLSGSARRIRELQHLFADPPDFGKYAKLETWNVHDVASVLRRFFNTLPEPLIPLEFFNDFREAFIGDVPSGPSTDVTGMLAAMSYDDRRLMIIKLQGLIDRLPSVNRHTLVYILDLLHTFAENSKFTLMTADNLSAVFQPCILSHPSHDRFPEEYRVSQECLLFMIDNAKNFSMHVDTVAASNNIPETAVKENGDSTALAVNYVSASADNSVAANTLSVQFSPRRSSAAYLSVPSEGGASTAPEQKQLLTQTPAQTLSPAPGPAASSTAAARYSTDSFRPSIRSVTPARSDKDSRPLPKVVISSSPGKPSTVQKVKRAFSMKRTVSLLKATPTTG